MSEITKRMQSDRNAQARQQQTPCERTRESLLSKGTDVQKASKKRKDFGLRG